MSRKIAGLVAMLTAAAGLVGSTLTAYADTSVQGTGSSTISFVPVVERIADGNTFVDYTFTENLVGIVEGIRIGTGEVVFHPDGTFNTQNTGIFTGTIAGKSGSAEMDFRGSGTFASAGGNYVVTAGTGGLAGVHAQGTDSGSATGPTSFFDTNSFKVTFGAP